jgi:hypothetical protein
VLKVNNKEKMIQINKIIIVVLLIIIALTGNSQTNEIPDISADRPGVATPPFIIQPKLFQIETGFSYEKITGENTYQETTLYNTSLLRYGIDQNSEIRLQTDYANVKTDSTSITGFNPLTLGTKVYISEQKGILPKTSFLFNLTLPGIGKTDFRTKYLSPSIYLLMQNDITEKLNICYNAGLEYDGIAPEPAEFAAICFGYSLIENLSGFVENYNWFLNKTKPQNYIDLGLSYLIGKNFQADIAGNMNLQDIENYYSINFGVSWRITKEKLQDN